MLITTMTLNVDIAKYTRNFTTHINRLLCVKKDTRKLITTYKFTFFRCGEHKEHLPVPSHQEGGGGGQLDTGGQLHWRAEGSHPSNQQVRGHRTLTISISEKVFVVCIITYHKHFQENSKSSAEMMGHFEDKKSGLSCLKFEKVLKKGSSGW